VTSCWVSSDPFCQVDNGPSSKDMQGALIFFFPTLFLALRINQIAQSNAPNRRGAQHTQSSEWASQSLMIGTSFFEIIAWHTDHDFDVYIVYAQVQDVWAERSTAAAYTSTGGSPVGLQWLASIDVWHRCPQNTVMADSAMERCTRPEEQVLAWCV
jgi:hypothetical protein